MSEERHPAINAAGLTSDVLVSIRDNIRKVENKNLTFDDEVKTLLSTFVIAVSDRLDYLTGKGEEVPEDQVWTIEEAFQPLCPDCGIEVGQSHRGGYCDVARCLICRDQRLGCNCEGGDGDIWTGFWPGLLEAATAGKWTRWVEEAPMGHKWENCLRTAPGSRPDLNWQAMHGTEDISSDYFGQAVQLISRYFESKAGSNEKGSDG